MVPLISVVMWVILSGKSLANPKSPIFGVKSLSRRTLLALISLCTIGGTISSWRYARPLAVPLQIADLFSQFNLTVLLFEPAKPYWLSFSVWRSSHNSSAYTNFSIYLTEQYQESCSQDIHTPKSDLFLEHSIQSTWQGLHVWHWI